jgi:uncharacterized protein YndB with AHSA1/START domain
MAKRSERPTGLTKDVGWEIGVRRTLPVEHTVAWRLITSPQGMAVWLGESASSVDLTPGATYDLPDGTRGEVRVVTPGSHFRLTWHPPGWPRPSTMQVRVIPKGAKTVIAFHQEHLPGSDEREARRAFFKGALDRLAELIDMT